MLAHVTATLADGPTAIIACVALALGVLIMARGARGGTREAVVQAPDAPPEAPTTFRHGAIKLAEPEPEPEPEPVAQLDVPPEPEPEPAVPAPPPLPQVPPTTFRQGSIRVGGIDGGTPDP